MVSGWVNTSQAGNKYMKLSFTPKDQAHNNGMKQVEQAIAPKAEPIPAEQYEDTDIPFWSTPTVCPTVTNGASYLRAKLWWKF